MKLNCSNQRSSALTLIEVMVVIAVLMFLAILLLPMQEIGAKRKSRQINCVNNLKEMGLAYQIWAGDHDEKYPMEISVTNGGTRELAEAGNATATFLIMSNELIIPKMLYCAADINHSYASNFSSGFSSQSLSYFIGLEADKFFPQTLLSGDDNFEIKGVPVKSGVLELTTNTPIAWSDTRHRHAGNLGLADGSVQSVTQFGLQQAFQQTSMATNYLVIP